MHVHFTKMHALGNDFVVLDATHQNIILTSEQIQQLSDRHRGIGFDQMLIVAPKRNPNTDFFYQIFNADGSESFQCGNGARCLARFIAEKKLLDKKHMVVETACNVHDLILQDNGLISVNMQMPEFLPEKIPFITDSEAEYYSIKAEIGEFTVQILSMGNPHCVLTVPNLSEVDVTRIGTYLSRHERFPKQTNVEFMQIVTPEKIILRVYERGVGQTLACGSGACAAVVAGRLQNRLHDTVTVTMPGGELIISWPGPEESVWMTGEATKVFDGEIDVPFDLE